MAGCERVEGYLSMARELRHDAEQSGIIDSSRWLHLEEDAVDELCCRAEVDEAERTGEGRR